MSWGQTLKTLTSRKKGKVTISKSRENPIRGRWGGGGVAYCVYNQLQIHISVLFSRLRSRKIFCFYIHIYILIRKKCFYDKKYIFNVSLNEISRNYPFIIQSVKRAETDFSWSMYAINLEWWLIVSADNFMS